jgi:hypothetical protein
VKVGVQTHGVHGKDAYQRWLTQPIESSLCKPPPPQRYPFEMKVIFTIIESIFANFSSSCGTRR